MLIGRAVSVLVNANYPFNLNRRISSSGKTYSTRYSVGVKAPLKKTQTESSLCQCNQRVVVIWIFGWMKKSHAVGRVCAEQKIAGMESSLRNLAVYLPTLWFRDYSSKKSWSAFRLNCFYFKCQISVQRSAVTVHINSRFTAALDMQLPYWEANQMTSLPCS